jgi:hypothetical protein
VRNTSGLKRTAGPGRPKGSINAPKIKQLVYRCLEDVSEEAYTALKERFKSKRTVQEALEFVAKLTGELKPQGGAAGQTGKVAVIFVGGGPNALTPEVFRAAAAARLAQRALDE